MSLLSFFAAVVIAVFPFNSRFQVGPARGGPRRAVDLPGRFVSVSPMASQRFSRLAKIFAGAVADADGVFQLNGRLERFVHFWALVIRQFIRHRCFVRASALSYSTLLALIPLLAVALSITSNFLSPRDEAKLARFVENMASSVAPSVNIATNAPSAGTNQPGLIATNALAGNTVNDFAPGLSREAGTDLSASNTPPAAPAVIVNPQSQVAEEIHTLVQKTSGGALGSIGLIFLVFTAVSLLRGIAETFNDMWGVTRGRNWWLQFMLYWLIITFGPLLLSAGLPVGHYFQHTHALMQSSPWLSPIYVHALPIAVLSLALALFYKLTPNTKVESNAAMIGGLCAGAAWHFYNQLTFLLASRTLSASKFYGGLALIVLMMVGLYVFWLIILFGAQMAYAYQNRTAYLQDRLAENVNQRGREFVALRIMTSVGRRFQAGEPPATVPQISTELGVPSRLTQSVLRVLAATRLVSEVAGGEAGFVPARPLDAINAHDILLAMRTGTGQELPLSDAPELAEIYGEFARIERAERDAASQITLLTLANYPAPRAALPEPSTIAPEKTTAAPPPHEPVVARASRPPGSSVECANLAGASRPDPIETAPVAPPAPLPSPEEVEPAQPPAEPLENPEPPRRETARPEEHTDFPL